MRNAECGIAGEGRSRRGLYVDIPHSEFRIPHYVLAMRHLYLHVPFCRRRCSYCDFSIAVRKRIPAREYVEAVLRELALVWDSSDGALETLYLGGGTPSLLPAEAMRTLLHAIALKFRIPHSAFRTDLEVTLEANPEDVTPDNARAWRRAGVNRVSLGAQSFDDRVLKWMHRPHDAARIGYAVRALRGAGIDNISLDLIFALPAELERDWARDLDLACSLLPAHLSLDGLTVEERTAVSRRVRGGAHRRAAGARAAVPGLADRCRCVAIRLSA